MDEVKRRLRNLKLKIEYQGDSGNITIEREEKGQVNKWSLGISQGTDMRKAEGIYRLFEDDEGSEYG